MTVHLLLSAGRGPQECAWALARLLGRLEADATRLALATPGRHAAHDVAGSGRDHHWLPYRWTRSASNVRNRGHGRILRDGARDPRRCRQSFKRATTVTDTKHEDLATSHGIRPS